MSAIPGHIYFAQQAGLVKIGRTQRSVEIRLHELTAGHPNGAILLHSIPSDDIVEGELFFHSTYGDKKVCGEWFKLTDEDIQLIQGIMMI